MSVGPFFSGGDILFKFVQHICPMALIDLRSTGDREPAFRYMQFDSISIHDYSDIFIYFCQCNHGINSIFYGISSIFLFLRFFRATPHNSGMKKASPKEDATIKTYRSILFARRTESSLNRKSVGQIQIRQCEHDIVFGSLFSQTSISCFTISE